MHQYKEKKASGIHSSCIVLLIQELTLLLVYLLIQSYKLQILSSTSNFLLLQNSNVRATHVPVGEDQKQHVDASRDITEAFNKRFGEFFPIPDAIYGTATIYKVTLDTNAKRIMSLNDAKVKMSKSNPLEKSKINITDEADVILSKIRSAKTDAVAGISYDPGSILYCL